MGGSLIPDFFKVHVNLAVMTGPVACTANIPNPIIRFAASKIKELQFIMLLDTKNQLMMDQLFTVMNMP